MDYTTLTQLKTWSDIASGKSDSLLEGLITACSRAVDQHCRQRFGRRTAVGERCVGAVDPYGKLTIWPEAPSVVSLSAVSLRHPRWSGTTAVTPGDLWWEDQECGAVIRSDRASWGSYRDGRLHVTLSGELGWQESEIPADFELQVRKLVFWAAKRRETSAEKTAIPELGVVIIPQAWPPDIKNGLKPYVRVTGF